MYFEQTIVYKPGGPYQCLGGTFDYKGVNTQEEFDAAIAAGWHADYAEMLNPKPKEPAEPVSDGAPTRAELEQKANELGLKFDGRTGDKKLGEMIAEALKV